MLQIGRSLVRSQVALVYFSIDIKNFRSHCDTCDDSASNRDEYQEYFLVVKADGRKAHHLQPPCALVTKSGPLISWNLLGLARPVMGRL